MNRMPWVPLCSRSRVMRHSTTPPGSPMAPMMMPLTVIGTAPAFPARMRSSRTALRSTVGRQRGSCRRSATAGVVCHDLQVGIAAARRERGERAPPALHGHLPCLRLSRLGGDRYVPSPEGQAEAAAEAHRTRPRHHHRRRCRRGAGTGIAVPARSTRAKPGDAGSTRVVVTWSCRPGAALPVTRPGGPGGAVGRRRDLDGSEVASDGLSPTSSSTMTVRYLRLGARGS